MQKCRKKLFIIVDKNVTKVRIPEYNGQIKKRREKDYSKQIYIVTRLSEPIGVNPMN